MLRDNVRRLATATAGTALLLALTGVPALASIPDPNASGYGFPASLPLCPAPVSVLVTCRDAFVTPEPACSTWVVIVLDAGVLDSGQPTVVAGLTALDGTITLTFAGGIGGSGTIHFDVFASTAGSGDIYLTSSGSYDVLRSCAGATDAPDTGPGGGWVNALTGSFPNPFRAGTTVRFSVGRSSPVRLTVHDVAGRRVATLVDERRGAGAYNVPWDGRDRTGHLVASGLYFCRLEIGAWSETRAMQRIR